MDELAPEANELDWTLLRKFNTFWPRGGIPADLPWLTRMVDRTKAWRWVSQFPTTFRDVEPTDVGFIVAFVGRTLTHVQPSPYEDGDKTCCKKRVPDPPIDGMGDDLCDEHTYMECGPPTCAVGMGREVTVGADCQETSPGCKIPCELAGGGTGSPLSDVTS